MVTYQDNIDILEIACSDVLDKIEQEKIQYKAAYIAQGKNIEEAEELSEQAVKQKRDAIIQNTNERRDAYKKLIQEEKDKNYRIEEENKQIDICFNGFTEEEKKAAVAYLERMCKNLENYK